MKITQTIINYKFIKIAISLIGVLITLSCNNPQETSSKREKIKLPRPCINAVYMTDSCLILKGTNLDSSLKQKGVSCEIQLSNVNSSEDFIKIVLHCDVASFNDSNCIINFADLDVLTFETTLNRLDSTERFINRAVKIPHAYSIINESDRFKLLNSTDELFEELFASIWIKTDRKDSFYSSSDRAWEDLFFSELFFTIIKVGYERDCNQQNYPDNLFYCQ